MVRYQQRGRGQYAVGHNYLILLVFFISWCLPVPHQSISVVKLSICKRVCVLVGVVACLKFLLVASVCGETDWQDRQTDRDGRIDCNRPNNRCVFWTWAAAIRKPSLPLARLILVFISKRKDFSSSLSLTVFHLWERQTTLLFAFMSLYCLSSLMLPFLYLVMTRPELSISLPWTVLLLNTRYQPIKALHLCYDSVCWGTMAFIQHSVYSVSILS